jgi:hypothetical protein
VVYLDWYEKNGHLISDEVLSERAHDEMLKYCLEKKSSNQGKDGDGVISGGGKGGGKGARLLTLSSSIHTAVHMFEDSIRSKLVDLQTSNSATNLPPKQVGTQTASSTPSPLSSSSSISGISIPTPTTSTTTTTCESPSGSYSNSDTFASRMRSSSSTLSMAVPSLAAAPYTIASTVNTILTTGWQRSQSSTSSSSTGSSGGGGGGNQYTSNTGGYSHLSVPSINHLGSGCVGSGDSNAANMNASPTSHGLAQLENLPSMYRDVRHLSKLKTFLSSSSSYSSSSSSSSKSTSSHYNHQMSTTMSDDINHPPTSVDEEEFLFSYLEKVKLDPLSASSSPPSSKQQQGGWNEAKFGHIFGRGGV